MHGSFRKMLKETIHESQKCQRNWDLEQSIADEDKQLIIESATNCPSKQNLNYYKLHVIEDRETIEKIHEKTKGFGPIYNDYDPELREENAYDPEKTGEMYTNSQTLAQMLLAFTKNEEGLIKREEDDDWEEDRAMAVGIAAGYVNVIATQLGYSTGCCKCMDGSEVKDILGDQPILLMGVGVADKTRNRREHQTEDFMFPTLKKMKNIETTYV